MIAYSVWSLSLQNSGARNFVCIIKQYHEVVKEDWKIDWTVWQNKSYFAHPGNIVYSQK